MSTKYWNRIQELCKANGTTPTAVAKELGLSSSMSTRWKNGTIPNPKTQSKIAAHFNVSTDYLLGYDEAKVVKVRGLKYVPIKVIEGPATTYKDLTSHEKALINAYRAQPELQAAVDKLLDL